jgi:ABC-type multidrug transport system fused ATPase/permease subunit
MSFLRRVSAYLFRYPWLFTFTIALAVSSTVFLIAVPRVIQWIIDDVVAPGRRDLLLAGVLVLTGCYLLRDVFNGLRIRVNNRLEQKVLLDLRTELHAKLLDLPVTYYDQRQSGEIASRVTEDVQNVERVVLDGTEQGTVSLLTILGISTLLFIQQPLLAALTIAPLPLLIWLGRVHFRAGRKLWREVREASGDMNALLIEDIQGNRLISSFALKERERTRFRAAAGRVGQATLRAMYRWSLHGPGTNFISSLGAVAVLGVGGLFLIDGRLTIGGFVAFFAYCSLLYQPVSQLNNLNNLFASARASSDRVFEILDHPVAIASPASPRPFPAGVPAVRFEAVTHAYPNRPPVLAGFTLTLPAGKVTALVGHTGAGKSTIANLLLRYYDVTAGRVLVGDTDVREFDLETLRQNIGFVAQEPFLFNGTIAENLRLARPAASDTDIETALRAAAAWDFVQRLPDTLDTKVGERGIRLSQGEKQRLTIARVILKNPPVVVLDEATASVDTLTEAAIQSAIETLVADRTTLVIAHRLSTIRRADQIVVLDHGRILECGSHAELLTLGGRYAQLWNSQSTTAGGDFDAIETSATPA